MSNQDHRYDLIVIGAGPGGYVAAIRAAQLGMRVACVEKEAELGGTCLRIGCIPSKALLDSSELYYGVQNGLKEHGIRADGVEVDIAAMLKRKSRVVKALTGGVESLFKKNGIVRFTGTGRLLGQERVQVEGPDEAELEGKHILIATGSAPGELEALPFDGERIVSSTEALSFEHVPERLLVVGASYIGLEMGSVWSRLGSHVTVVEMMDQVVPGTDSELAKALKRSLEKQGLRLQLGATAKGAELNDGGQLEVLLQGEEGEMETETFDKVLVAVGRQPYTAKLGLEDAGVETDERGRIVVDEHFRTSTPGLCAIGDVIDRGPMLAHVAQEEGVACVERMAGLAGSVNYEAIPGVIYTQPELAWVGKTEQQCQDEGMGTEIGEFPFRANGRARAFGEIEGRVRIVADATSDRVLGVQILGPRASDLIAECVLAMEFGASSEDIARSCHAHPSFPEAIKEAALDANGRVIHI